MQKDFDKIKAYTYWIKNKTTGMKYFGVRWNNISRNLTPNQDFGKIYFSSGRLKKEFKENPDNFEVKLIATFDNEKDAIKYEHQQNKKNIKKNRYANISAYPQIIMTEDIKQKISRANLNPSPETRERMSKWQIGGVSSFKGRKHTQEAIKKIKIARAKQVMGKVSDETKRKMSILSKERMTDEMKVKISKANKGRKHTEEAKKKLSEASKKNMTPERRELLSEINKGNTYRRGATHTKEAIKKIKIARANQVIIHSDETRKKMSISAKERMTDEIKVKISKANKGRKRTKEEKLKMSLAQQKRHAKVK